MAAKVLSSAVPAELEQAARQALDAENVSASTFLRRALARAAGLDPEAYEPIPDPDRENMS